MSSIWADVIPVPQNDGPNPLVPIMYSDEYRDAMGYFRAISASGEKSERVLGLTESIIRLNPAHYTVWQYRFQTLLALQEDLKEELELMNEFARENLKSYQVWHHRLLLMTHISPDDPSGEIEYIHRSLQPDPKNYHTWAYLHWLFCHFSQLGRVTPAMWDAEQRWAEELLKEDGRNNSAWGWRWFLRMGRPGAEGAKDGGDEEIDYALNAIHGIPHNVSAWNYLRGLVRTLKAPRATILPALAPYLAGAVVPLPPTDAKSPWAERSEPVSDDTPLPVPFALEFYADTLVERGRLADAAALFDQLGTETDRIRAAYWAHRKGDCMNA